MTIHHHHQHVLFQMRFFPKPCVHLSPSLLHKYLRRKASCEPKHCKRCRIPAQKSKFCETFGSPSSTRRSGNLGGSHTQFPAFVRLGCGLLSISKERRKHWFARKKLNPPKNGRKFSPKINPTSLVGSFGVQKVTRKGGRRWQPAPTCVLAVSPNLCRGYMGYSKVMG